MPESAAVSPFSSFTLALRQAQGEDSKRPLMPSLSKHEAVMTRRRILLSSPVARRPVITRLRRRSHEPQVVSAPQNPFDRARKSDRAGKSVSVHLWYDGWRYNQNKHI